MTPGAWFTSGTARGEPGRGGLELASSASAQGAAEALNSWREADDEDQIMANLMKSCDEATSMEVFKHLLTVGIKEAHVDGTLEKCLAKLNVGNSRMHLSDCDREGVAALCRLAASLEEPVDEPCQNAELAMLSDQACPSSSILELPGAAAFMGQATTGLP